MVLAPRCVLSCLALLAARPLPSAPADSYRVYVSSERSGEIAVIDGATQEVLHTIPVGKRPRGLHVAADGRTLYVATSGSPRMGPGADPERARSAVADKSADGIAVVDLAGRERVRQLRVGSDPEEFALSRDGTRVIVANEDIGRASIWDLATGRKLAEATVTGEPEGVALHPVQDAVYVTCEEEGDVFVLDPRDGREVARLRLGGRPRTVTFTPDGALAFVPLETKASVAVVDARAHRLARTIPIPPPALPMDSALSPDGRELYVSTGRGNEIVVLDLATDTVAARIPVGTRPWGIGLSPDGRLLYTANGPSDDVSVVDVRQRREVKRIPLAPGAGPWGIAIGPAPASRP